VVCAVAIAFVWSELKPDVVALREHATGWRRALYDRIAGDYDGSPEQSARLDRRIHTLAPILCLLFAYLFSLLAFDLMMSLAPYWYSNLFGAYYFMGAFLTGLTMLALMTVYWRGRLDLGAMIGVQQFHDLGKLIFGFTVFWAYLTYSHIVVIWYGNLPEETPWLFVRTWGAWQPVALLVLAMVFVIPFWGLIWVKTKITPLTFSLFATISLLGMWLERYIIVVTSLHRDFLPSSWRMYYPSLVEVGVMAGMFGFFFTAFLIFIRFLPVIAVAEVKAEIGVANSKRHGNHHG